VLTLQIYRRQECKAITILAAMSSNHPSLSFLEQTSWTLSLCVSHFFTFTAIQATTSHVLRVLWVPQSSDQSQTDIYCKNKQLLCLFPVFITIYLARWCFGEIMVRDQRGRGACSVEGTSCYLGGFCCLCLGLWGRPNRIQWEGKTFMSALYLLLNIL